MKKIAWIFVFVLLIIGSAMADGIRLKNRDLDISKNRNKAVTNVLFLMQEEDRTQMVAIASLNTANGKAVMVSVDPRLMVEIPEIAGEIPLSDVYRLGDQRSGGLLVARTLNRLLDLNISMYLSMKMSMIPEIVDEVGGVWITPTAEENQALGLEADTWALSGEEALAYMRLSLPGDEARNRSYEVMMQILRQIAGEDLMQMMTPFLHGYQCKNHVGRDPRFQPEKRRTSYRPVPAAGRGGAGSRSASCRCCADAAETDRGYL